ncbi:MAG TPA: hypothetical protein VN132_15920, partial [Bdellovibrio sp.]|nr:hypothetical protein [Bdellovibrio sp.]
SKFGIVPETAFYYKNHDASVHVRVKNVLAEYRKIHGFKPWQPVSYETAMSLIENAFDGIKIPRVTDKFKYLGKEYTARSYASEVLHFRREDYYTLMIADPVKKPQLYEQQMRMIKKTLLYGYSIPMTVGIFNLDNWNHHGIPAWDCEDCSKEALDSGPHSVLMVDYKTSQSDLGEMSLTKKLNSLDEPVDVWAFKNSWGFSDYNTGVSTGELFQVRNLPTWGTMSDRYFRGANQVLQLCDGGNCTFRFDTLYKNPYYKDSKYSQVYAIVPRSLITSKPAKGPADLYGWGEEMDLTIDSRLVVENKVRPKTHPDQTPLIAEALKKVDQHKVYAKLVPTTENTQGNNLIDVGSGNSFDLDVDVSKGLVVQVEFPRELAAAIGAVALTYMRADATTGVWADGDTQYEPATNGKSVYYQVIGTGNGDDKTLRRAFRIQPFTKEGVPVGAPLIYEFLLKNPAKAVQTTSRQPSSCEEVF